MIFLLHFCREGSKHIPWGGRMDQKPCPPHHSVQQQGTASSQHTQTVNEGKTNQNVTYVFLIAQGGVLLGTRCSPGERGIRFGACKKIHISLRGSQGLHCAVQS